MASDPAEDARIHDGRHKPQDFERLRAELMKFLREEATRNQQLPQGASRDLDRAALAALFAAPPFDQEDFGLDFEAPLAELMAELYYLEEDLGVLAKIYHSYPDGIVPLGDLVPATIPDDFGPED